MIRSILYVLFGLGVIGAYAYGASTGTTVSSTSVQTQSLPSNAYGSPGGYGALPIIWYTGFHGPAAYRSSYGTSSGGGSSGGYYGGFGGGK